MAKEDELQAQVAVLNREALELEFEAEKQARLGAEWHTSFNEIFNKLSASQIEADWHFQRADTALREAKKKRKEAIKLERKARRVYRRRNVR